MENLENISLLFIDDDAETAQVYVRMLNKLIRNVYVANDGLKGLRLYKKHKPDIIISDIKMPVMSGLDMVEKIRESDQDTKIIILSAYSEKEKLFHAIKLGLVEYLVKPVKKEKLKELIYEISEKINSEQKIKLANGYRLNSFTNELFDINKVQIKLTKKELLIFKLLSSKKDGFFTYEKMLTYVYGDSKVNSSINDDNGKLRTVLSRLKTKLNCELIESIYGYGYRLKTEK